MTPDVVPLVQEPSWSTVLPSTDIAAIMRGGIVEPHRLCDGLLYSGTLHSLAGEPEAGKTTVAAWWATRLLAAANAVVWLDEESGHDSIADRLLALGADPDDVHHGLHFVEFPGLVWTDNHVIALRELLDDLRPAMVVFDSAAGFLGAAGLGENDNDATGGFYKRVLLRAARHGDAAVVVLDHIAKNSEGASRYARGAGSKLGFVDVAYSLEQIRPFTRAESGVLKLIVRKDRRGWLHRQYEIVVDVDDGHIEMRIDESIASAADAFGKAAGKILEALEASSEPLTNSAIVDSIAERHGHGLRRETVSRELNKLLTAGLVDELDAGHGTAKRWSAVQPREGVTSRDDV